MAEIEPIKRKIYEIRGQRVILDRDLAALYGVGTKVLVQAVKRNIRRFPEDFMFQLTREEFLFWKSQIVTSKADSKVYQAVTELSEKSQQPLPEIGYIAIQKQRERKNVNN